MRLALVCIASRAWSIASADNQACNTADCAVDDSVSELSLLQTYMQAPGEGTDIAKRQQHIETITEGPRNVSLLGNSAYRQAFAYLKMRTMMSVHKRTSQKNLIMHQLSARFQAFVDRLTATGRHASSSKWGPLMTSPGKQHDKKDYEHKCECKDGICKCDGPELHKEAMAFQGGHCFFLRDHINVGGNELVNIQDISNHQQCCDECAARPKCMGSNYNLMLETCSLKDAVQLQQREGKGTERFISCVRAKEVSENCTQEISTLRSFIRQTDSFTRSLVSQPGSSSSPSLESSQQAYCGWVTEFSTSASHCFDEVQEFCAQSPSQTCHAFINHQNHAQTIKTTELTGGNETAYQCWELCEQHSWCQAAEFDLEMRGQEAKPYCHLKKGALLEFDGSGGTEACVKNQWIDDAGKWSDVLALERGLQEAS